MKKRRELSLTYLTELLTNKGLMTDDQARTVRAREPQIRQKVLRAQEQKTGRVRYTVSAVEVVAAMEFAISDGRRLNEDRVMEAVAADAGLPFMKLDPLKLDAKLVTDTFSRPFARHNIVIPVSRSGANLTLAISDPFNLVLQDQLKRTVPGKIDFCVASKADILRIVTEFYGFRSSVAAAANEQVEAVDLANLEQFVALQSVDQIEANDAHVVNAVEYLLHYAFGQRASDIHIEPKRDSSQVRLRIDGILHRMFSLPKVVHAPFVSRIKMLARMDIAEKRRPQDGRIKTQQSGQEVELRVSSMPVAFGEKLVIRIFDPGNLMQDLAGLGMHSDELQRYETFLGSKTGLILVTGPTGSGKTTTLYSTLRYLNGPGLNITTIEDPIEMVYDAFNQVQVQSKIGLTFATALRTVLRQDPDVVMVGEIRDAETANMAVQGALTGHLVFSTLHTNDAPSTVTRMLELGVKPFLLASTLVGVVAQRLLRTICPDCKRATFLTDDQISALDLKLPTKESRRLPVKQGNGCSTCRYTGTLGRTAVFEVMHVNETLRKLVHEGEDSTALSKAARADGMLTLKEAAIRKLAQGETAFEEVIRVLGTM